MWKKVLEVYPRYNVNHTSEFSDKGLVKVGTSLNEKEIRELLTEEKTGWLATVSPEKRPHLIPIHFGFFDGKVHVVFVHKSSKSLRYIQNNSSICFGVNVGEKEGEIKCVLILGKGGVVDDNVAFTNAYLKILTKYLSSKDEAEAFFQKLTSSQAIAKRTLVVIKPEKTISWKL